MPSDELSTEEKSPRFYDSLKARFLGWIHQRLGSRFKRLAEFVMLLPDITVLLCRVLLDPRGPRHLRIKVGIIVTYLTSPLDLIPEAVAGSVGLLDDVVLTIFALNRVFVYVDEDILQEHWSGRPEQLDDLRELSDLAGGVLTGRYGDRLLDWYEKSTLDESDTDREARVELVTEEKDSEEVQVERFRAAGL